MQFRIKRIQIFKRISSRANPQTNSIRHEMIEAHRQAIDTVYSQLSFFFHDTPEQQILNHLLNCKGMDYDYFKYQYMYNLNSEN